LNAETTNDAVVKLGVGLSAVDHQPLVVTGATRRVWGRCAVRDWAVIGNALACVITVATRVAADTEAVAVRIHTRRNNVVATQAVTAFTFAPCKGTKDQRDPNKRNATGTGSE
jgi:hypothetical protein